MSNVNQYLRRPELTAIQALDAPVSELVKVTDEAAAALNRAFQIKTIHDLAESPYFESAEEEHHD